MGAPIDLPSRGAVAFLHTLQLAADKAGHTHLPWGVLLMHTQRLLAGTGLLASWLPSDASVLCSASQGVLCNKAQHEIPTPAFFTVTEPTRLVGMQRTHSASRMTTTH